jgi:ATP adenylyltransferase
MSFDHLWAGWRSSYVTSVSSSAAEASPDGDGPDGVAGAAGDTGAATVDDGVTGAQGLGALEGSGQESCIFCKIFASDAPDRERHVIWESPLAVVVLNAYPYASGHVLVMPRRHVADLGDLDADESVELWETTRRSVAAIKRAYSPDGLNLGANLGRAAGAGIPGHVHLHVLPRWVGDTNFMTTVASTRVLPEPLPESWEKLRSAWPT